MATRPGMVSAVAAWCDCARPWPIGRVTLHDIEVEFHNRLRIRRPTSVELVFDLLVDIILEEEHKKTAMPNVQVALNVECYGGDEAPRAVKKHPRGPRKATAPVPVKRTRYRQLKMFKKTARDLDR